MNPPPRWRFLDTGAAAGAWNMAVDEALAESVAAGGPPVLRVYRWEPACLSLGRNQPAAGAYDQEAITARGLDVVRRPTGGRAVLHARELTYSVAVPLAQIGSPRAAYAAINQALVAGLRRLGVPALMHPRTGRRAPAPSLAPCFAEPVEGEVVAAGRKLVGSAQRRLGGVILQHGSIPIHDDQSLVAGLLAATDAPPDPPATLAELLGEAPAWEALAGALREGWREALGVEVETSELSPGEHRHAQSRVPHYTGPAWTWHR